MSITLKLEPAHAESARHAAQILLGIGRSNDALKSANRAIGLSPDNAALVLTKAAALSRYGRAMKPFGSRNRSSISPNIPSLLKAHAYCQLAELTAGAGGHDKRAIGLYMQAIKTAQPLVADPHVAARG